MKRFRIPHILFAAMLIMAFFLPVSLRAQDADPAATVETMPIAIVTEEAEPPSITCEEGATCVLNTAPADETSSPANSVPVPVVIGISVMFGILFIGLLYNMQAVTKIVGQLIPAEAVPQLIDAVLPKVVEGTMNLLTPRIPGTIDDALFIEAARQRGLTAVRDDITGLYHVSHTTPAKPSTPYPPSSGTPLGIDLTIPSSPASDGGAPGSEGTGFPSVR